MMPVNSLGTMTMATESIQLNVRIPPAVYHALALAAEQQKCTIRELVLKALAAAGYTDTIQV